MYLISNGSGYWAKGRQGKKEAGSTFVQVPAMRTPCLRNISPSRCLRWQPWASGPYHRASFVAKLLDHLAIFQTKFR
jgi:hypothetical protein